MYRLASYLGVLFFVFILWVIYQADTGRHNVFFDFVASMPYGDKLGHIVLFGLLTLGANIGTKFRISRVFGVNLFTGGILVSLFVIAEEFSQYFFPARTLDIMDLLADLVGIISFTLITLYIRANAKR